MKADKKTCLYNGNDTWNRLYICLKSRNQSDVEPTWDDFDDKNSFKGVYFYYGKKQSYRKLHF